MEQKEYWGDLPKHEITLYLSNEDYKYLDNIIYAISGSPTVEFGMNMIARFLIDYGNPTWIFRGPRIEGRKLTEEELDEYRLPDDYKEKAMRYKEKAIEQMKSMQK